MVLALEFGDQDYRTEGAEPTYPNVFHSQAAVSYLVSNMLRQAYHYAQTHARVLLCQNYSFNTQLIRPSNPPPTTFDFGFRTASTAATDFVGVARAWCRIPKQTNAVRAQCLYGVGGFRPAQATHYMSLSTATDEEITSNKTTTIEAAGGDPRAVALDFVIGEELVHAPMRIRREELYLPFVGGASGFTVEPGKVEIRIRARAFAKHTDGDYDVAITYYPLFYMVIAEMVY